MDATQGIDEIIDGNTVFRLRKPMNLAVRREGRYVFVGYEPLGIEERRKTVREALEAFAYHFGALWQEVGRAHDGRLTRDARALKRELRSLVEDVGS